jgi:hypothetical protein
VAISGRADGDGEAGDEDRLACIALYMRRGPPTGEPLPAKLKSSSQSNCGCVSGVIFCSHRRLNMGGRDLGGRMASGHALRCGDVPWRVRVEPMVGIEPTTYGLRIHPAHFATVREQAQNPHE